MRHFPWKRYSTQLLYLSATGMLIGPETYSLKVNSGKYSVTAPNGKPHFVSPATKAGPKLYLVFEGGTLIYVGVAIRAMASRLRDGFKPPGKNGYHGYAWKHLTRDLRLDIWYLRKKQSSSSLKELESLEAEVVYLFRSSTGQWPKYQTEIHFHPSTTAHRDAARRALDYILSI